jgi:hypothetical protein
VTTSSSPFPNPTPHLDLRPSTTGLDLGRVRCASSASAGRRSSCDAPTPLHACKLQRRPKQTHPPAEAIPIGQASPVPPKPQ